MSAAGALWALIVASVITTGLNTTCQAYRDTFSEVENFPYVVIISSTYFMCTLVLIHIGAAFSFTNLTLTVLMMRVLYSSMRILTHQG